MSIRFDVIALGELLVDMAASGKSEQENDIFEACPGGAPCNVLAMLSNLGKKTAFIGKVGQDMFGTMLKNTIDKLGINTEMLYMDENVNTTLAFVKNNADGDREFSFYRNPGADMMLKEEDIDEDFIRRGKIFHHGTLSMTHFDEGIAYLKDKYDIQLILLTLGKDGSRAYYKGMRVCVPTKSVQTVDNTGAGDTFCGCALNYILEHGLENLSKEQLEEMLMFANIAAAIVTTRKGALKAMPGREEIV